MRARDARKLHNHDEVIIKETGESALVIGDPKETPDRKIVILDVVIGSVFKTFDHTEIK